MVATAVSAPQRRHQQNGIALRRRMIEWACACEGRHLQCAWTKKTWIFAPLQGTPTSPLCAQASELAFWTQIHRSVKNTDSSTAGFCCFFFCSNRLVFLTRFGGSILTSDRAGGDEAEVFNVDCRDDLGQDSLSFRAVVVFMKTEPTCAAKAWHFACPVAVDGCEPRDREGWYCVELAPNPLTLTRVLPVEARSLVRIIRSWA